jgi:hypothetical protein
MKFKLALDASQESDDYKVIVEMDLAAAKSLVDGWEDNRSPGEPCMCPDCVLCRGLTSMIEKSELP